jgi:phage shock protein A
MATKKLTIVFEEKDYDALVDDALDSGKGALAYAKEALTQYAKLREKLASYERNWAQICRERDEMEEERDRLREAQRQSWGVAGMGEK